MALLFTDVFANSGPYHTVPYCNFDTGLKQTVNASDDINLRFEVSWADIKPSTVFGEVDCI
jgi:hypothetical protein